MFIAHAPAGYLLTRILSRTLFKKIVLPERTNRLYQYLMIAGISGNVLPDFDFIYHFFIDPYQIPHHKYWTHIPFFWLGLWGLLFLIGKWRRSPHFIILSTTFCLNAIFHLVLDTITGMIYWFYPLSSKGLNVFKVADGHVLWINNFMYHWTFLIEVGIIAIAMIIFLRIKETTAYLMELFGHNKKLRLISMRIGVCMAGIMIVILVGSMRFNIDNRLIKKVILFKNYIFQMAFNT